MKMCCSCSWSRWSATLIISRVLSTSLNSLNSLGYVQLEMSLTRWILLILVLCKGLINNHNITRFSQFSNWIIFLNIYCEGRRTTLCYYCVLSHTHTHTERNTAALVSQLRGQSTCAWLTQLQAKESHRKNTKQNTLVTFICAAQIFAAGFGCS